MNQPLVSIISPVYNHERYIREGIESIINQSYQNIELIVINDGSPDRCGEIIESLTARCEERFQRFLYIDRPNLGLVKTLNEGLAQSQGQYVATLPSDDSHYSDSIETLVSFLEEHQNYSLAVGDNTLVDDNGKRVYWDKKKQNVYHDNPAYSTFGEYLKRRRPDVDFDSEQFGSYTSLLKGNYIPNGYLMRRTALQAIGGYSESSGIEDHTLVLGLAKHGPMKYFDRPLYNYRWHSSNSMKSITSFGERMIQNLNLEKEYCFRDPDLKKLWEQQLQSLKQRKGLAKTFFKLKRSFKKRLKPS